MLLVSRLVDALGTDKLSFSAFFTIAFAHSRRELRPVLNLPQVIDSLRYKRRSDRLLGVEQRLGSHAAVAPVLDFDICHHELLMQVC